jgi:hypothetical protein
VIKEMDEGRERGIRSDPGYVGEIEVLYGREGVGHSSLTQPTGSIQQDYI